MKHPLKLEKFIKRNENNINRLNEFIGNNKDNILSIYTSYPVLDWLKELPEYECLDEVEQYFKYNGINGFSNEFCGLEDVYFIMKTEPNKIEFDIPCMCGIYKDEPHIIEYR